MRENKWQSCFLEWILSRIVNTEDAAYGKDRYNSPPQSWIVIPPIFIKKLSVFHKTISSN